ncbi:GntR family transcriptional regulator [Lapidilactobacillus mulanensis]|uniref:GntR family transcriptional regulator n=1 Tax=Lapidilactobacillus mulanensis TaxID=2485999 RepID=A0ABW4DRH7_9LACO|nr:GntR family transcriptional regulator [Lapidilactobacillus mulanensis]
MPDYSHLAYYQKLVVDIKQQVLLGVLQAGDKLPSVREMATRQQLNPNTVAKAYKQLEADGIIYVETGKGSFISASKLEATPQQVVDFGNQLKPILIAAKVSGVAQTQIEQWVKEIYRGENNDA